MAKFEITSPDGRRFEITAPDGTSQDEALKYGQQQFGADQERPKTRSIIDIVSGGIDTAKNYALGLTSAAGQGVAELEAGLGDFTAAPFESIMSGAHGARAMIDRGVTGAINSISPGSATVNEKFQRSAQTESQIAASERAKDGVLQAIGGAWRDDGRYRVNSMRDVDKEYNPELIRQQQEQDKAEGFTENVAAFVQNPLASSAMLSRSAPAMAAGVGLSSAAARTFGVLGKSAAAQTAAAGVAGTASEAGLSAVQARESVHRQVSEMPTAELEAKSPRFRELKAQTGDSAKAQIILANEVADQVVMLSGAGTAAGSVISNKLLGDTTAKMVAGQRVTGKEAIKNIIKEGPLEEGTQSVLEDAAQHGAMLVADDTHKYDPGGSLAQGMMAGTSMAAGGTGATYGKQKYDDYKAGVSAKESRLNELNAAMSERVLSLDELKERRAHENYIAAQKEAAAASAQAAPDVHAINAIDAEIEATPADDFERLDALIARREQIESGLTNGIPEVDKSATDALQTGQSGLQGDGSTTTAQPAKNDAGQKEEGLHLMAQGEPIHQPGATLENGFRRGATPNERYRVGPVSAVGGALMIEKRNDSVGSANSFYIGKDGNMVDSENVHFNRPETVAALWIPHSDEAGVEAQSILGEMGTLELSDPKRAQLKTRLKELVAQPSTALPEVGTGDMAPQESEPPAINVRTAPRKKPASESLIQAIINRGGISREIMSDVGGDRSARHQPGLFTNNGTSDLSELAQMLFDEDGFHQINQTSDIGPARELKDMIRRAIGGERILNTDAMERDARAEEQEKKKQELLEFADEYGVERSKNPRDLVKLEGKIEAAITAEISKSGAVYAHARNKALDAGFTEDEVSSIEDGIAAEFEGDNLPRDYMVKMWRKITEAFKEKINERKRGVAQGQNAGVSVPSEVAAADNEAGREGAGEVTGQPESAAGTEEGSRPELNLEGQTNEEAAAEHAAQQDQSDEVTKEQADNERDAVPFSLAQQSQPKPTGTQSDLLTPDGRATVAAQSKPDATDQKLEDKFRLNPVAIISALTLRGQLKDLHKQAGVRGANAFDDLPMDDKAAAYVKMVKSGIAPVKIEGDYNAKVAKAEHDAEVRRMQSETTIRRSDGKPFKSKTASQKVQAEFDLVDTHEIRAVDGGFVLQRLGEANRPSVLKAAEERRKADPAIQRQEAAFARAELIGDAAKEAVTAYENGDSSIEEFEAALDVVEKVGAGETAEIADKKTKDEHRREALKSLESGKSFDDSGLTFEKDGELTNVLHHGVSVAYIAGKRTKETLLKAIGGNVKTEDASKGLAETANTEDSGEELTYNLRNRRTSGLTWDEIKGQEAALRVKEVTKAKVYPKPDYEALAGNDQLGSKVIAHFIKQVYDSIAPAPATGRNSPSDEQLQQYIEAVNRVMEGAIAWAKDAVFVSTYRVASNGKPLIDAVYPAGWRESRAEVILLGGNKFLSALRIGYDEVKRAEKDIGKGWPAKREAWQTQGFKVLETAESVQVRPTNVDGKYYLSIDGHYSQAYPNEAEANAALETMQPWLLLNKNGRLVSQHASGEAATEAARDATKRGGKEAGVSDKGIKVTAAQRTGTAHRAEGENITSDRLIEAFGFKGVNFGTWMKGKGNETERQLHLNHAYDSFMDLADILGVPPKAMSLNGMLGIAFGAQGRAGAAAHFVPGVNEINLTRESGAGSLGHEFGHALDHYFARLGGLDRQSDPFLTEHAGKTAQGELRPEVLAKFKAVVTAMNQRPMTPEEHAKQEENYASRLKYNVDSWLKSIRRGFELASIPKTTQADAVVRREKTLAKFDEIAERIRNLNVGDGLIKLSSTKGVYPAIAELRELHKEVFGRTMSLDDSMALQSNVQSLKYQESKRDGEKKHEPQTTSTDYTRNAAKLDKDKGGKPYWNTNLEKFARAFDAFLTDTLAEKAAKNSYLSHTGRTGETVPEGTEREAINAAFRDLVDAIQTKETERGVAMFNAKSGARGNPLDTAALDGVIARVTAASPSHFARETVIPAPLFADLPAPILSQAKKEGYDDHGRNENGHKLTGVTYDGKVYLVQENISSELEAEETLLHERIHQILNGNAKDPNGLALRKSLNALYFVMDGKKGIEALAKAAGADISGPLAALPAVGINNRNAFLTEEFLAHAEGRRAYEKLPAKVKRAIREWWGQFRDWLRSSGFARMADAVGADLQDFTQSDLAWTLKNIRSQEAQTGSKAIRFMTAFHGTPYEVDRFKTEHIGTGEGAQAYGWGLYFAGAREVAEFYRNKLKPKLSGAGIGAPNIPADSLASSIKSEWLRGGDAAVNANIPRETLPEAWNKRIDEWLEKVNKVSEGRLYQVELAPAEDELLNWGKPLSEQSDKVRAALDPILKEKRDDQFDLLAKTFGESAANQEIAQSEKELTGEALYNWIADHPTAMRAPGDRSASKHLHSLGIRGIRYLDGSSRSAGEGSHNYVIFDDADVKITAKLSRSLESSTKVTEEDAAELLRLLNDDPGTTLESKELTDDEQDAAEAIFLSDSTSGTRKPRRYGRMSRLARSLRAASDAAANDLGREATAERKNARQLGPFSGYQTRATVDGDGTLNVEVFGDEQFKAGLDAEPALTFNVTPDGALIVNGPSPLGKTFKEFEKRGWAEKATANGEVIPGWSRLTGKLPLNQVVNLLGEVHARTRLNKRISHIGLHWQRATGMLGLVDSSGGAIFFSRLNPSGNGIALRDLNAVVDRVSKGFKNLPRVHVLSSPDDLSTKDPAQKALRDFIRKSDAWNDVEGATHDGEIYLFASGMADEARAEHVLATHEITHYGLRGAIGKDLDAALQNVLLMNAKVRKASVAMKLARNLKSNIEAVEEVLADIPTADLAKLRGWRKVVQVVRNWLNKAGAKNLAARLDAWMKSGLSDQEKADLFVADLVNSARDWVRTGKGGNSGMASMSGTQLMLSRAVSPAPTSAQTQPQPNPVTPWQKAKAKAASILTPERIDKAIYEVQDKLIDLRRLRDHIKAIGGVITDLNDAYLGEEMYHKRLAKRTHDFLEKELKPLLADMRARAIGTEEFETFLHARHAPEANAAMAKRNPTQAEIDAGRKLAADEVKALELQLQSAKAKGSATKSIEQALNEARGKLSNWNGAQSFQGTEAERLSLSGMSDAEAKSIMDGLPPAKRAHMDALAAKVDAINAGTLDTLEKYGLMEKSALDAWRGEYKNYVPLHRDEAHQDSVSHPIGQGFSVKGDAAKRRTGSNEKVTHILGHIAMQRESALTRGEKNNVMRRLYLMAKQNPLKDFWTTDKVPTTETIDKKTGFVQTNIDPLYKTRPNVLMLRIAGKDVAITINAHNPQAMRMAEALKNLDVDDLHYIIPVVGKATRYFASINTQYNPIFGIINFIRDVQGAALNLSTTELAGKEREVMTDTLSIMGSVLKEKGRMPKSGKWASLFDELQLVGGTTGYRDLYLNAEDRANALLKELKSLDRGKAMQAAHAVADWLSDYNEAMENSVRMAAYKAALDNGLSKERAASVAKNLTVNFNRKGRQTREIGALYAFFNAAVQGTNRVYQTLSGPAGKKIMAGGVLVGAVSALAGIAMMGGGEDDEWEKIPEFIKERSLIIPISKEDYIAIPMPLGFHFLPNIGRLAVEMFAYKDKTVTKQLGSLISVLADAFNPFGGSAPALQMAMPTVVDPLVSLAQNKDWTGKPIYVEDFNSLDPEPGHKRVKESATPWSKAFSEAINAITGGTQYTPGAWSPTPDQIDYVIGQMTGGVGRELGKVAQSVAAPFTGDELPPHKIPLVGRLYGNTRGPSGQSEKFYENIKRANEAENEIKGRLKDGKPIDDYVKENPGAIELSIQGNFAERQVRSLREMRKDAIRMGIPNATQRKREINDEMAAVMRGFNKEAERLKR